MQLSAQLGVSPPQVALAWLLHKPGVVTPIIGARCEQHLQEAVAAVNMVFLEEPYQPHPILGH